MDFERRTLARRAFETQNKGAKAGEAGTEATVKEANRAAGETREEKREKRERVIRDRNRSVRK